MSVNKLLWMNQESFNAYLTGSDTSQEPKPALVPSQPDAAVSNSVSNSVQSKGKRKSGLKPKHSIPPVFTKKENATLAQRIEILGHWFFCGVRKCIKCKCHANQVFACSDTSIVYILRVARAFQRFCVYS
jgi:hypothetical protein